MDDNPYAAPHSASRARRHRSRAWRKARRIGALIFFALGILLLAIIQWTGG